jgi:hypothetical protein
MTVGINNRGLSLPGAAYIRKIIQVNMAVNEVFGLEGFHKPEKGIKPPMTLVAFVVNAPGRRMGQKYVHPTAVKHTVPQKPGEKPENLDIHFKIRILIEPLIVTHGASQPGDDESFLNFNFCSDMDSARTAKFLVYIILIGNPGGTAEIPHFFNMVVAKHKEQGFVQAGNDKIQVIQGKIPGRKDQIHIGKTIFYGA